MNSKMVDIKSWRVCAKLDNDKNLFEILTNWMNEFENFDVETIEENIRLFVDSGLSLYNNKERQRLKSKIEHYFL